MKYEDITKEQREEANKLWNELPDFARFYLNMHNLGLNNSLHNNITNNCEDQPLVASTLIMCPDCDQKFIHQAFRIRE